MNIIHLSIFNIPSNENRVDKDLYEEISKIPLKNGTITYHEMAKIISMEASALENRNTSDGPKRGKIIVACAGTTDLPVAEEAAITLEKAGVDVERIYDVGEKHVEPDR